jgi:hypothetical protein
VQTTVTPSNKTVGSATVSGPRTITSTATAQRGKVTTLVGAASGLPNDPSKAGQQFTSTVQGQSQTVSTTNNVGLAAISGETRQLHILTAPGDISFKLGGLKTKVYWDFAYNLSGKERYEDIYQLRSFQRDYSSRDSLAWLVGLQLGELKKKGDWQAYLNYRETGIASVDPNLNDGDFALGELNMRGFKLGLAYALSDAVVFSVTGYMAWNMDKDLIGGRATNAAQAAPLVAPGIAESNSVNVVQVDVAVKF